MLSETSTSTTILRRVAMIVRKEMKDICSDSHDSIIRDSNEGVRNFRWDSLFYELSRNMPTCVSLLLSIIPGKDDGKRVMLLCVIVSMMLKKRYPKMAITSESCISFIVWKWLLQRST